MLIGNIANNVDNKIENVIIEKKNMSIFDFQSIIIQKINSFFENNGKPVISSKLCQLFVRALNHKILEDSIVGKVLYRDEFKSNLIAGFNAIEEQIKNNPLSLLLPDAPVATDNVKTDIIDNVLKLFGWKNMTKKESQSIYNEHLGQDIVYTLDYWADYESPLKDSRKDVLYINADIDANYSSNLQANLKNTLHTFDLIRDKLITENRVKVDSSCEYNINFMLSLADSDKGQKVTDIADLYKSNLLDKDIVYYLVDNYRLDFLVSSIITANAYRPELPVKYLYPITEDNSEIKKIGKRGTYMPPQFLNSSILPIIKEDSSKISVLLFCSDIFTTGNLRKLIWLLLRLTSGLANEYILYFPDYDQSKENIVSEVLRNYGNNDINLKVERISYINVNNLKLIPADYREPSVGEQYDESKNKNLMIQPHLIEYLPYGDSMRPFLASDAVKAVDLKAFLSNKGFFFKSADKTKK